MHTNALRVIPGETLVTQDEIDVLLKDTSDNIDILSMMLKNAKKQKFVEERHTKAITQIACGSKAGKWKTYVGEPRREVVRPTKKELLEFLYDYYVEQDNLDPTYAEVFEELMDYKLNMLNRELKTIKTDRGVYRRFNSPITQLRISEITEEMVIEWVKEAVASVHPKPNALKRMVLQIINVFDYGVRKHYCDHNPARNIDIANYVKSCDLSKKSDEEKEFSIEELDALEKDALDHTDNPRALMMLLGKYTGMRAGEMPALLWEDISEDYIHIHRQQLLDDTVKGQRKYSEVTYTKNERTNPDNGRHFPITKDIRKVLELAGRLPGKSDHVFHDRKGQVIRKDSYELYLRRRCRILGITTTNNHAFRMSLNSRLIELGLNASQRALLLGHTVRTNELHYSLTDRRRLNELSVLLKKCS